MNREDCLSTVQKKEIVRIQKRKIAMIQADISFEELLRALYSIMRMPPPERVWDEYCKQIIPQNDRKGCWYWSGIHDDTRLKYNYATFRVHPNPENLNEYEEIWVHRCWSVWLFGIDVMRGWVTDHAVCSKPRCVNPFHLEPCTDQKNRFRQGTLSHTTRKFLRDNRNRTVLR